MTDDELEQRLRAHYREIDPGVVPRGLSDRIDGALDRRRGQSVSIARMRPALAAAMTAVVIVAVGLGLGLRPGGFLAAPGPSPASSPSPQLSLASPEPSSPSPSASASPSPSPSASPSLGPSPTPTVPLPSGSVPPISSASWTGLRLQAIDGGPVGVESVVAWSGGYLALGHSSQGFRLTAWISRDGRRWVALPAQTFGQAIDAHAAALDDGLLVATEEPAGEATVWRSADGVTWTSSPAPALPLSQVGHLAGSARGVVAIGLNDQHVIAFSADGIAWQTVTLPGSAAFRVQDVATFGTGFVAVGDAGPGDASTRSESPVAWRSADGRAWKVLAVAPAHPGDGFVSVEAGGTGLMAYGTTVGATPGLGSFWTSSDGRGWTVSAADPLGIMDQGEGSGSANGLFSGDGTRILAYGIRTVDQPAECWVSFDATHWTKLALTGDAATALAPTAGVRPFLLRDGVLFSGDQGSWFGATVK
jgi:hypothetical protein